MVGLFYIETRSLLTLMHTLGMSMVVGYSVYQYIGSLSRVHRSLLTMMHSARVLVTVALFSSYNGPFLTLILGIFVMFANLKCDFCSRSRFRYSRSLLTLLTPAYLSFRPQRRGRRSHVRKPVTKNGSPAGHGSDQWQQILKSPRHGDLMSKDTRALTCENLR